MRIEFCCERFGGAFERGDMIHDDGFHIGDGADDILFYNIDFCPFCGKSLDTCIADEEEESDVADEEAEGEF